MMISVIIFVVADIFFSFFFSGFFHMFEIFHFFLLPVINFTIAFPLMSHLFLMLTLIAQQKKNERIYVWTYNLYFVSVPLTRWGMLCTENLCSATTKREEESVDMKADKLRQIYCENVHNAQRLCL